MGLKGSKNTKKKFVRTFKKPKHNNRLPEKIRIRMRIYCFSFFLIRLSDNKGVFVFTDVSKVWLP